MRLILRQYDQITVGFQVFDHINVAYEYGKTVNAARGFEKNSIFITLPQPHSLSHKTEFTLFGKMERCVKALEIKRRSSFEVLYSFLFFCVSPLCLSLSLVVKSILCFRNNSEVVSP